MVRFDAEKGRLDSDKGRSEYRRSEGSCSHYGFANAAGLVENIEQGEKADYIVKDIAGIVEAYQNTKDVAELTKEECCEDIEDIAETKNEGHYESKDDHRNAADKEKK